MNIYILNYNNYYNRIVKKEETISDYSPYIVLSLSGINFIPNDGINTTQIVNCNGVLSADYFIAEDEDGGFTRWFILENERIRNGQYKLTLRRDLMADYYEPIVKSPCFIERGTVDINSPFIFNSEGQSYNQIKTSETLLKDKSGCPWIVGYMARNDAEGKPLQLSGSVKTLYNVDIELSGNIDTWEYYDYVGSILKVLQKDYYGVTVWKRNFDTSYPYGDIVYKPGNNTITYTYKTSNPSNKGDTELYIFKEFSDGDFGKTAVTSAFKKRLSSMDSYLRTKLGITDKNLMNDLFNLNGKVISYVDEQQTKRYKRINFKLKSQGNLDRYEVDPSWGGYYTDIDAATEEAGISGYPVNSSYFVGQINQYRMTLVNADESTFSYDIPASRVHPIDAPYDMFCIPYSDDFLVKNIKTNSGYTNISLSSGLMLNLATALATQSGGAIYDLQLLPYCPVQGLISAENEIDLITLRNDSAAQYAVFKSESGLPVGVMIFPDTTSFTFNIELVEPILITEPKIQSECDMYRLCSPNFGSAFEFNAAKNGGINYFNVDCTYMPYNPYIHINPDFGQLYGQDFNDARGLICAGEFSLPKVDSAWAQYQLQNKNYQASFDRQIQSMEVKRDVALQQGIVNAVTGTVTGAASGAAAGGMLGGPAGAIAGGVLGGAASAAGGVADVYYQDKLMKEDMSLQKDMFAYQLGNIKAMPQSLSRTTAFTNNNKYFPVLEYYTCTEEEKEALRQKIKYRGMSVNIISTIENFIQGEKTYIKGKIIRIDDISEDFNLFTQIMFEIDKGIYIGG